MKQNADQNNSPVERSGAHLVAAGIFLSRIAGLIRQRVFAHYFGNSDAGDAFYSALKIPNFLQNLFGEGVLSASFIPVYAGLLGKGEGDEAEKVARVIGSVLALLTSLLVLLGIWQTPHLIGLIAPGFTGDKKELTIRLVQVFFPGTGLLVMSAWCLGILNSHRKFFLSYAAPVLWNAAIIAALVYYGGSTTQSELALHAAWGLVLGSALQFGIQLPTASRFLKQLNFDFSWRMPSVRIIGRNFVPVVIARGVVQVSAYVDNMLASYLPSGAVSALAYAQLIYMLPISLFGMAVSAAELPAMSRASGSEEEIALFLRKRIDSGLKQISFFIVPAVMAFLFLGDTIVAALYQSGEFTEKNSLYVWAVLAGSSVGLLASTLGRLYSSAFYSLKDTRTPLRFAVLRVALTIGLGYLCGLRFPIWFGFDPAYGTVGLTASAGIAGWLEFLLLRKSLNRKLGPTGLSYALMVRLWGAALLAALLAFGIKRNLGLHHPVLSAFAVLVPYGVTYVGTTAFLKVDTSMKLLRRIIRR
ncbi:MAG: murein biosynthesis integral membrane protein MurJ [Bdellovibrionales bacterium]|nr:murein biosynthesis integral membrane protein MurJ [Oligoflexia bacterium]